MANNQVLTIAVLDIGTQTFRMAVLQVEVSCDKRPLRITPLISILRHVRLGEHLSKTGQISEDAFKRGLNVLQEFHDAIKKMPSLVCMAVGTHVLRQAQNAQNFIESAAKIGFELQVITPEQEAELTALGVRYSLPHLYDGCCIMDLGGGSVEFIRPSKHDKPYMTGTPLGCVGLLECFPELRPPCQTTSPALDSYVKGLLAPLSSSLSGIQTLIAVGGAATSVAFLAAGLDKYDSVIIRGFKITRDLLTNTWKRLADSSQQKKLEEILSNRLDILPAGIFILSHTLNLFNLDEFIVSDSGLLFGLFIKAILKEHLHVEPSNTAGIYI